MKIPCENCLTLAICISLVHELQKRPLDTSSEELCRKCSLFADYLVFFRGIEDPEKDNQRNKCRKIFRLEEKE
jgi:hypothetical protein